MVKESNQIFVESEAPAFKRAATGLSFPLTFATPGVHPYEEIQWEKRSSTITDEKGEIIFEQKHVEVPSSWSQLATNVVASKYLYGELNTPEREVSVRQLVERVVRTIADWGKAQGYFATEADGENFYNDLAYLCVNQYGAFNSPVWFNVGLYHQYGVTGDRGHYIWNRENGDFERARTPYEYPQCSACFIQSVDDNMESIMSLATSEAMLFKFGSGTGTDLSQIRSRREKLSGGGRPSGPLSFMRVYDQIASVVKSGGKTRRAAKMQSLMDWHPDILDFIRAKSIEEKKAWALIEQGYDGSYNGDAYSSVMYQNANVSVRISDEFMNAALNKQPWTTRAVTTGKPLDSLDAFQMLWDIADGTRICGDPGVQYHTTINAWHTCPVTGPINASNPCSEYMFLDDSACNLASLNLMKFRRKDGSFDTNRFRAAVRVYIAAQEILVDNASYPTHRIAENSHKFRPLGLGYANLGSLVMAMGYPYDSDEGRAFAGAITAIMGGTAYEVSAEISEQCGGPFESYPQNRRPMLNVMRMHRAAVDRINARLLPAEVSTAARVAWDAAIERGERAGYRNSQVTVLAPTGTIGFMMDCDTTGVEPDIALVKYKLLAGGGVLKIVNRTVPEALEKLGYSSGQIAEIVDFVDKNDTIEGAPHISDTHLAVFDCAFKPAKGNRAIHYLAHLKMMAAAQPFLSGAISKTVNMPKESTTEEILNAYVEGWKLGLKALAIYRDGSKRSQPLNTKKIGEAEAKAEDPAKTGPQRRRMPDTRNSITHKFEIAGHEGYLTVGLYEDGMPGELFVTMAKEGSTVGGLMDAFGTMVSISLQYGVPLQNLVEKFSHTRFEPAGFTKNEDIPIAKSIIDYLFRWMGNTFIAGFQEKHRPFDPAGSVEEQEVTEEIAREATAKQATPASKSAAAMPAVNGHAARPLPSRAVIHVDEQFKHFMEDAPACDTCGSITVRNGACYRCFNCGNSMGCS